MNFRYLYVFIICFISIRCTHTHWEATHFTKHPLVGKILNKETGHLVELSELKKHISEIKPDLILLGEVHDHPDHHTMHAKILENLGKKMLLGTLFLEHLDLDQNKILPDIFSGPKPFVDLEKKLNWGQGWDDFRFYEPMIKIALKAGQNIKGVNISRRDLKSLVKGELVPSLTKEDVLALEKIQDLSGELEDSLAEEIVKSHCNMFPKQHAHPIVKAQTLRDKIMTHSILSSLRSGKISVFIGGNGHVRIDRGVPFYLSSRKPKLKLISIGFIQVDPGKTSKELYRVKPYDFIFFTPVFDVSDPCEKFRKSLEKMRKNS